MPIKQFSQPRTLPSNQRAIDPAKRALDRLAPYQQKKYEAAFFVNPIEILLYSKLNGGIECSCTFGDHDAPAAPILGIDGKASPATIQTLLTGKRFGITDYGTVLTDVSTTDREVAQSDLSNPAISAFTFVGRSGNDPRSNVASRERGAIGADTVLEGLEDDSPPDLQQPEFLESDQLNRSLRSTDNRSCPVCFGSGYVGGYSVQNGWRRVFDCRDNNLTIVQGEIDAIISPNRATVTATGYAEYLITFPKHVHSIDAFRVMNGKFPAKNVYLSAHSVGSNTFINVVDQASIKSFCDGNSRLVRILSLDGINGFQFTHLEIQFNLSDTPLLAEFPRFGENSDLNMLEKLQDVQINMTNKVVSLHSEDVLSDSSVRKIWRVSAAQFYRDHSQNIIGWDCNASIVQPYETQSILPKRFTQKSNHQQSQTPIRQIRKT